MFSIGPMGVVGNGDDWICAVSVTAVIVIVIYLFACGGSVSRRRSR